MPRFQTIPAKLNSDLVGMRRPRSTLGRIQVEFHLELLRPLTDTYWTALPPLPPTFGGISRAVPRANNSDDLLPDLKAIKWNVHRIETVVDPKLEQLADVCRLMPTYAHVCSRMLTYAEVC
jgi:hypothetical protein